MNNSPLFSLLLIAVLAAAFGCEERPHSDQMPDLLPAKFKLIQEGTPVEGAIVRMYTTEHHYGVYGKSDADGIVELKTNNDDNKGAPVGKYKVTVSKVEITPSKFGEEMPSETKAAQEWQANRNAEYRPSFDLVNWAYKKQTTTNLTVAIKQDGSVDPPELELGPPTRDEFIPPDSAPKPDTNAQVAKTAKEE